MDNIRLKYPIKFLFNIQVNTLQISDKKREKLTQPTA